MAQGQKGPTHDLAARLTALETAVQKLSTQDVLLNATFGPGLTVAQAYTQLMNAIATNVVPSVNTASAASYTLTTGYQTLASFNFTVPTGYTRALVTAVGSAGTPTNATADEGFVRVLINGTAGQESRVIFNSSSVQPNVPASFAVSLTGLSAGTNIPVDIQAHLLTGPGSSSGVSTANLTATTLFLP